MAGEDVPRAERPRKDGERQRSDDDGELTRWILAGWWQHEETRQRPSTTETEAEVHALQAGSSRGKGVVAWPVEGLKNQPHGRRGPGEKAE